MKMNFSLLTFILAVLLLLVACTDSVSPAGMAQYVNPEYPSTLTGYAVISSLISGGFTIDGRVYILDTEADILESFSLEDNYLDLTPFPVTKDTLHLNFRPGKFVLNSVSGIVFIENISEGSIFRVQLPDQAPELIYDSESIISDMFLAEGNSSLVVSFLGPEWLVRKIDVSTGSILGEFATEWPITRSAISTDGQKLLVSNSSKNYLLEIDVNTMELIDTLHLTERSGPFIYNNSGNIVVFNQYSIDPKVFLYDGNNRELIDEISSINPYRECDIVPGTDVVIAPRRTDNRISILNSQNLVFAPSLFCLQSADLAFSTQDGQTIIVLSKNAGRVYIYSHQ